MIDKAKKRLARLAALYQGCLESERRLDQAAQQLYDHHTRRSRDMQGFLKPAGVDPGLEAAYLDSLREKGAAARLGKAE